MLNACNFYRVVLFSTDTEYRLFAFCFLTAFQDKLTYFRTQVLVY